MSRSTFRVQKSDYSGNGTSPWVVQVWSVFYNGYQTIRGGFVNRAAAQAYIDSGQARLTVRNDKSV
jgi:hypothetical protein